jgi:phosphoribosyl-AMP cyclohydrolase
MSRDNSQVKSAQVRSEDHNVVIDISNNNSESTTLYCSHCNTRLVRLTQEDKKGAYLCVRCQIEYWPKQQPVKKADKLDLPGPSTDEHGNVLGDIDIHHLFL